MCNLIFISLKSQQNIIAILSCMCIISYITLQNIYYVMFNIRLNQYDCVIIFKVIIPNYCNENTVLNLNITVNCCVLDIISYNLISIYIIQWFVSITMNDLFIFNSS